MPGKGPDNNGLYEHPDGTMRREYYGGPLDYTKYRKSEWSIADQFRVMFGGEPRDANRELAPKSP